MNHPYLATEAAKIERQKSSHGCILPNIPDGTPSRAPEIAMNAPHDHAAVNRKKEKVHGNADDVWRLVGEFGNTVTCMACGKVITQAGKREFLKIQFHVLQRCPERRQRVPGKKRSATVERGDEDDDAEGSSTDDEQDKLTPTSCERAAPAAAMDAPLAPLEGASYPQWMLAMVVLLVLAIALIVGRQRQVQLASRTIALDSEASTKTSDSAASTITMEPYEQRHVLAVDTCTDYTYHPDLPVGTRRIDVWEVMHGPSLTGTNKIFFMLNEQNEGVYVYWNNDFNCIGVAAVTAALWLGADADEVANGLQLYSPMGKAIRNAHELEASRRLVHILVDMQRWQWPGIRPGYTYELENGVTLTTVCLSPKVFKVDLIWTQLEMARLREQGESLLYQMRLRQCDLRASGSTSSRAQAIHLPDDPFTHEIRRRVIQITRLRSRSFAERLLFSHYASKEQTQPYQLTATSDDIIPAGARLLTIDHFHAWCRYAAHELQKQDRQAHIPRVFREGGALFPQEHNETFHKAFLHLFLEYAAVSNYFEALNDTRWKAWIHDKLTRHMPDLLAAIVRPDRKPHYLAEAIRTWEKHLGISEIRYNLLPKTTSGEAQYYHWIRWMQECIAQLRERAPRIARSGGGQYPSFHPSFIARLVGMLLDDDSPGVDLSTTTYQWLSTNRDRPSVLTDLMKKDPTLVERVIRSWELRVSGGEELRYTLPKWVRRQPPRHFALLKMELHDDPLRGKTTHIQATLRYAQTAEGEVDSSWSQGAKTTGKSLSVMLWNSDAVEGEAFWSLNQR